MSALFIYNVTCKVSNSIHEEWLKWMKEIHIPEVLATGRFTHHRILRLLEMDDADGITYAIQYFCTSIEHYHRYIEDAAPGLRQQVIERWGDNVISFRTIMEVIN